MCQTQGIVGGSSLTIPEIGDTMVNKTDRVPCHLIIIIQDSYITNLSPFFHFTVEEIGAESAKSFSQAGILDLPCFKDRVNFHV